MNDRLTIIQGDAREKLLELPDESVQCCVTSPPYWGLRNYGIDGQLGLEKTPDSYVYDIVGVFLEVWRVLKNDGTLWLNLGDSYWTDSPVRTSSADAFSETWDKSQTASRGGLRKTAAKYRDFKNKDLVGIPWMVAFAMRLSGWYLRQEIVWAKSNPMPESVTDRCTRSHEKLFMLSKRAKYFYDYEAIVEPCSMSQEGRVRDDVIGGANGHTVRHSPGGRYKTDKQRGHSRKHAGFNERWDAMEKAEQCSGTRNKRDVWNVSVAPYSEAHFATYPPDLIKPCILAGSRVGDTVLDPFAGSGTTGMVALELGRKAILIELNPEYIKLIEQRTNVTPGLAL